MNIGQIKIWTWGAAGVLTLGLSAYVFDFITLLEEKRKPPDRKVVQEVLDKVQAPQAKNDDLIPYTEAKRILAELNWTGKVKAVEAPPPVEVKPELPIIPVKKLVSICMVKVDLGDRKGSRVYLKYKPEAGLANNAATGGFLMKEGDHLAALHEHIAIETISAEGVVFAF